MKPHIGTGYKILYLVPVLGLFFLSAFALGADAQSPPAPSPAAAETGVPLSDVPPMPEGTVLFDSEARFGERGQRGGYAMPPSKYGVWVDSRTVRPGGDPGGAVYIRYKKAEGISFTGVYTIILGDLSPYATMTFWIKGDKGGEAFEIGMNDTVSNKREDAVMVGSIHRYLPGGVTKEWQQVSIPMEDFFGADPQRVYSIVFNFNEAGTGKFWIDGPAFHTEARVDREKEVLDKGELLLDNFDHSDVNLLGRKANAYKRLPSVCEFSRVGEGPINRSLRLKYSKAATGWCGYYTLLNQIDGAYYDLSAFKEARFKVKGEKGGETFEIGMADRSWLTIGDSVKAGPVEKFLPGGVTTQWQEVVIPLSAFGKLDWSQMGSFVINFYKAGEGTLYIDDLRFVRKTNEDMLEEWGDE
ncbi:MAG: hypothetical protein HYZ94_02065 [Candidatus Omnitrophica bacterium]|nr:hypothetical protein [Candidatus Omnitrophota bacterium]